jgi:urease accessory protein
MLDYERPATGMPPALHGAQSAASGWEARLALRFPTPRPGARTVLGHAEHAGPLRVQRPFYPEGDPACHVYVLHPPGGVVGGDTLQLSVEAAPFARALLTAPGATKLYRSQGATARIHTELTIADDALVELFPHELIAYAGCAARQSTHVRLAARAGYAGWEILCLGRPTSGERFETGRIETGLRIEREGRVIFQERGLYVGGDALLSAPWGLGGAAAYGTFVVAAPVLPHPEALDPLRELCAAHEGGLAGITAVSSVLVLRATAPSTRVVRALFERAFATLRPHYAGSAAVLPRIWRT